jgi:hypothetical protein
MASAIVHGKATEGLIRLALRGALTKAQARRLSNEDPEILALALLAALFCPVRAKPVIAAFLRY